MAAFDTTRTTYGATPVVDRLASAFNAMIAAVVAWNDARVTRNSLNGLTDRELDDIGLTRGDIEYVADSNLIR